MDIAKPQVKYDMTILHEVHLRADTLIKGAQLLQWIDEKKWQTRDSSLALGYS